MDEAEKRAAIEAALRTAQDAGIDEQVNAVAAIVEPTQATANDLWRYLVIGLLILLGMAIIGTVWLALEDKDVEAMLAAFSGLLSGLLGFFIGQSRA